MASSARVDGHLLYFFVFSDVGSDAFSVSMANTTFSVRAPDPGTRGSDFTLAGVLFV